MANGTNPKVRFVKCPRCLRVLLEDEDVPVYQCGGCSTILQAKNRNISANGTSSSAEAEGTSSTSPDMAVPSSGEYSAGKDHENGQNGTVDTIDEQLGGIKLSNGGEISSSEADQDEAEVVVAEQGSNSGSSSIDHVTAAARAEYSPEILTASPDEEEHDQRSDYHVHPYESGEFLAKKTVSAYDGSVSSSDGREDQLQDGQMGLSASVEDSARLSLEGKAKGKSIIQEQSEGKERDKSSSAMSPEEKHNRTSHKNSGQNTFLPLQGWSGDHLDRHRHRRGTREFPSYMPYYQKGPSFSSAYEHGSPSYHSRHYFDVRSQAFSLQMPPYSGNMHSGPGIDRMYHGISYGINTKVGRTSRASGIPFSGESVVNRRHHVGHPSWYSDQLHLSHGSYPGSPQRHMENEYRTGWSRDVVSDVEDQQRRGRLEVQRYLRERKPVAKCHIRPTAGGAPFASCYHCSQTLQLPVDFLISKRKYHLLRCGTCSNVLRFSLQHGTHLVPVIFYPQPESSHVSSVSGTPRNKVSKPEKSSSTGYEELPVARGSPLHRLMGYSTVSQVFKASQRPPSLRVSEYDQTLKN
ncbi:PREDICTED: protein ENHANCED DISEASE RESISTANCE 4 [Tarenaya hassleriana]|uniref:protein ENHANCED DISEASE RESISTANCE 4 n=1 Tax=Tarenaya hassleriana TaxID=28532 RepID=UPI00053CA5A4|nr:PREDICTED: protein ENHANCED DISEASE RESISTANCE 4 [Tarenaya hassleriana]XP_010543675.1 PREDICTED: protein ENHANCED DISEASE RESISTANCE 4 [Tarenaya hassleriana]